MRLFTVLVAGLLACSSPPPKPETMTPAPDPVVEAPIDFGRQFAAAWADVLEIAATAACDCADDPCRGSIWMPVMVWLRDAFDDDYDLEVEISGCDMERLVKAREILEQCASTDENVRKSATREFLECPDAPAPRKISVEPWWEGNDACPDGTKPRPTKLPPPFPRVFRVACTNPDNAENGRYTSFHLNGSVFLDGTYKNNKRHGEWKHYYAHGMLASTEVWVEGTRHGAIERVHRNGAKRARGAYRMGERFGPFEQWMPSGESKGVTYFMADMEVTKEEWEREGETDYCMLDCRDDWPGALNFSVTAKRNLERGKESATASDWQAAARYFKFVIDRFPYSQYKPLAEAELRSNAAQYRTLRDQCQQSCTQCSTECSTTAKKCIEMCTDRFPQIK